MLELGLKALLGYFLGSLNGSLVLGNMLGGPDVRTVGSGNAGGTNALRARGKWFALGVIFIDVGKGILAAALLPGLQIPGVEPDAGVSREWLALACAGAAVIGHCYPVWFGFIGGKGGATAVGVVAVLAPTMLFPALATWVLIVTTTGFVGLATMLAAAAMPMALLAVGVAERLELLTFLVLLAVFIAFTHRSNVLRMLKREERRMAGLMLVRRSR